MSLQLLTFYVGERWQDLKYVGATASVRTLAPSVTLTDDLTRLGTLVRAVPQTATVSILSFSIHGFLGKALSEKTDVRPEKRTNLSS